jgi:hypothetical protein
MKFAARTILDAAGFLLFVGIPVALLLIDWS